MSMKAQHPMTRRSALTAAAEKLLRSFPPNYRETAIAAVQKGRAFCPSCVSVGMMNCGYFDECAAFIEPTGRAALEGPAHDTALTPDMLTRSRT